MLFKRWITAIILIPFLIIILLKGSPVAFSFLIAGIVLISMKEYFTIVSARDFFSNTPEKKSCLSHEISPPSCNPDNLSENISSDHTDSYSSHHPIPLKIKICGYAASLLIIFAAYKGSSEMVILLTALNIMIVFIILLKNFSLKSNPLDNAAKQIQGVVYIPVFLSFLVFIRNSNDGAMWIIWLWLIIAASDTGAYYCGTYFGKRALSPKISPNKTIEGSAGGIAAAVIVGIIFGLIYMPDISFIMSCLFAFIAAAAGQLGDLFESALKRAGCIKDSGIILPGHGGILDRIDGLIFAAPVAFFFKYFILNM